MHPSISKYLVYYPAYLATAQHVWDHRPYLERTQWLSAEELKFRQWEKLKKLLNHVYETVPFYKRRLDSKGIIPSDVRSCADLNGIPPLTKDEITRNINAMISDSKRGRLFPRKTSGSSGQPLYLLKDATSLAVMDAVMYRNYGWYGVSMADRQARFWGIPLSLGSRLVTSAKDFSLNRIRFSPFDLSEEAYRRFLGRMRTFRPAYIYGYAQTIYRFAEFIASRGIDVSDIPLKCAIVTGEMIFENQLRLIETALGCKVSNEYGCTEVGIVAMTCPEGEMHLMAENLIVEFVKDGRHALPGEEAEIYITELYGETMPLIRYRLGDRGAYSERTCRCGRGLPLLDHVAGRNDDFIRCPNGRMIDPIVFEYILQELPAHLGNVTQFRITQSAIDRLEIEMCYRGCQIDHMAEWIERRMKKLTGHGMAFGFRAVDAISVEPSGKLRCFISELGR